MQELKVEACWPRRATFAIRISVRLSARLSVRHTPKSRLNGSRYRNTLHTIQYRDDYSFLRANFAILNLWVYLQKVS